MVVEIVDTEAKINEFLLVLDKMMTSGLVTLEKVQVLQYGPEGLKEGRGLREQLNVRFWHKADILNALTNVRFWG